MCLYFASLLHLYVYLFLLKAFPSTINKVIENLNWWYYAPNKANRPCVSRIEHLLLQHQYQLHLPMVIPSLNTSEYVTAPQHRVFPRAVLGIGGHNGGMATRSPGFQLDPVLLTKTWINPTQARVVMEPLSAFGEKVVNDAFGDRVTITRVDKMPERERISMSRSPLPEIRRSTSRSPLPEIRKSS